MRNKAEDRADMELNTHDTSAPTSAVPFAASIIICFAALRPAPPDIASCSGFANEEKDCALHR